VINGENTVLRTYLRIVTLVAVGLICTLALSARAATQTTVVAGLEGDIEGGWRGRWWSHLGNADMIGIRQQPPDLAMKWQSAPVPATVKTSSVTFAFPGALGMGPGYNGYFTISVNGRPAADFDAAIEPSRFVPRAKGCELLYQPLYIYWSRTDSSGYFYLTVPAGWVKAGERATLEAKARNIGHNRWFSLLPGGQSPTAIPDGPWEPFVKRTQPATPPKPGTEASYEWYKPQYSDPGLFTTIGPPGDPAETAVSPNGQILRSFDNMGGKRRITGTLPEMFGGALAFALYDETGVAPIGAGQRAHQALMDGTLPIVLTSWRRGPFELRETTFAEPLSGKPYKSGQEQTLAWAGFDVTNRSDTPRDVTLLAFIAAPNRGLRYRDEAVFKGDSALFSAHVPQGFTVEYASTFPADVKPPKDGDPLDLLRRRTGVHNALVVRGTIAGRATARLAFNHVLDFPGTWHWRPEAQRPVPVEALRTRKYDASLEAAASKWRALAKGLAGFSTPDPVLNRILYKAMLDGYFLTKRWNGRSIVFDSVTYRCQWDDASTKWFYALDLMGDHATSGKLLDTVFLRQGNRKPDGTRTHEGSFSDVTNITKDGSAAAWSSCNGWALWAMAEHARLSNDRAWISKYKSKILAGAEWIGRERAFSKEKPKSPYAGLLFGKFVCDMPGGLGYFAYADAVSYLGLREMGQLLKDWGHAEGDELIEEAAAYRKDIIAACDRLTDKSRDPWYVPWMWDAPKNNNRYLYDVVGPINLAFGGVLAPDDERIQHVIRWIIDETHKGSIESATAGEVAANEGAMFYSQDLAIVLLELGRVDEFLRIFYTLLAANISHETLTTCEWRSNTQPHIHSISSLIRMVRTMLIQERDGALYLLQGTPRRWLADGEVIRIAQAPTWYGPLSLECRSALDQGRVVIQLKAPERIGDTQIRLKLRLPKGTTLTRADIKGRGNLRIEGEWIILRGLKGDVELTVHADRK